MDLLLGGDLRYHVARKRKFSEEVTRFFIGCLVHALESVHCANIIHRDIKPENLVFDN
jgi:serine/threonine kinase 32